MPITPGKVGCTRGSTVYQYATIGNLRPYVRRCPRRAPVQYLKVKMVMNITDVAIYF